MPLWMRGVAVLCTFGLVLWTQNRRAIKRWLSSSSSSMFESSPPGVTATTTTTSSLPEGDIGALLSTMGVDSEPSMPDDMFALGLPSMVDWCTDLWPAEVKQQADAVMKRVGTGHADSNQLTTLGNFIVRCVETHMANLPLTSPQLHANNKTMTEERRAAMLVAMELFRRAIAQEHHYGALHSRGLALRLYPTLLRREHTVAAWASERDLCASQEVTLQAALKHAKGGAGRLSKPPPELLASVSGCDSVRLVYDWQAEESVMVHGEGATSDDESGGRWKSTKRKKEKPTTAQPPFIASVRAPSRERPIVVQGLDAVVHDLPRPTTTASRRDKRKRSHSTTSDGTKPDTAVACAVFQSTARCYPALWRQFQPLPGRQPSTSEPRHFSRLASVAHFSSGQYFHWLLDGLPRLLALADGVDEAARPVPLLLPAVAGGADFVAETIELVHQQRRVAGKDWPFNQTVVHEPGRLTTTDELVAVHWRGNPTESPGNQLLTPAKLLRSVRAALAPPRKQPQADLVVFVRRTTRESRALVNEAQATEAVKRVAHSFGLGFQTFDGAKRGVTGALEVFPRAAVVVGVHGAGLANAVFSQPDAALVEVALPEPEFGEFRHLASAMSLSYYALWLPPSQFESQVWVHPARLAAIVEGAIKESPLVDKVDEEERGDAEAEVGVEVEEL